MISLFHWRSFYFDWDEYAIRFRYVSNKYYIYLQTITDIIVSIRYGAKMLKYDLISVHHEFTTKMCIPPEPVFKNVGQQIFGPDSSNG